MGVIRLAESLHQRRHSCCPGNFNAEVSQDKEFQGFDLDYRAEATGEYFSVAACQLWDINNRSAPSLTQVIDEKKFEVCRKVDKMADD